MNVSEEVWGEKVNRKIISLLWNLFFFSVHLGIAFCRQLKGEKIYQQVTFSNLVGCSTALQRNKESLIPGIQQV